MMRTPFVCFALASSASAQLAISELHLDPTGPNGALQTIEITNISSSTFTSPGDWTLCARPLYPPLPMIPVAPGASVRVHIGATGTDTATDWFIPGIPVLALDGELAIYSTNFLFADPTQLVDFVSWGNGESNPFMTRMAEAVTGGNWPSPTVHVALPPEGNATAAWVGEGDGPQSWYIDTTPTLGSPNNAARFTTFGAGCMGTAGIPALDTAVAGARPWLGTTFALEATNLAGAQSLGLLVLSFTETPAQNLVPAGLGAGCQSFLTPDSLLVGLGASGTVQFPLALPLAPSLEGVTVITQVVGSDPGVASAAKFTVSNAARVFVGLQ